MAASMGIVINQGTWTKISPEDQQIMLDCYNEIMPQVSEDVYNNAMKFKQVFIDNGTTIYYFTDEEQAKLADMFQSYWDKSASSLGYEDLLAEAIALR
jgi:TRAP-type C4-dicarboxylate transport system substrate-binding protein